MFFGVLCGFLAVSTIFGGGAARAFALPERNVIIAEPVGAARAFGLPEGDETNAEADGAARLCVTADVNGTNAEIRGAVRLHVLAANDSPDAQAFKLRVRDEIIAIAEDAVSGSESAGEAYARLNNACGDIGIRANALAAREGREENISVETGVFAFDERVYMGKTYPAGYYPAMRVLIGPAGGHNWWCALYDPPREDTVYYSAIIEWLLNIFGGD